MRLYGTSNLHSKVNFLGLNLDLGQLGSLVIQNKKLESYF